MSTGRLALVLVGLALLPDLDVIGFYAGIPYAHPLGHRGLTHSLLFAVLAGAGASALWLRSAEIRSARFFAVVCLCSLACASHGLLDALTNAGLGVGFFIPIDNERYFFDSRPLIASPLSVGAFVSEHGLAILANEAWYVGIPSATAAALGLTLRRLRATRPE